MSKSQANEYWTKVWVLLKKKFELEKDKLILKHTQKYWDIYEHALMSNDFTNARQSLNDLAKLQGLNEPDKVHITGTSIKLNFGAPDDSQ
jgi:leucyl aminopeptidase (aminopeptidase T)